MKTVYALMNTDGPRPPVCVEHICFTRSLSEIENNGRSGAAAHGEPEPAPLWLVPVVLGRSESGS